MRRAHVAALSIVGGLLFSASPVAALASTVTVGTPTIISPYFLPYVDTNCFPFGSCVDLYSYQQVYSSAAFTGPLQFNTVSFFPGPNDPAISGNFNISFSITSAAVNHLSADQASNVGIDSAQFFSGTVNNVSSFVGSTYTYDPALGNLLVTITGNGTANTFELEDNTGTVTSRAYDFILYDQPDQDGLVTQFSTTAVTPEPSSGILVLTGMASMAAMLQRRLRRV